MSRKYMHVETQSQNQARKNTRIIIIIIIITFITTMITYLKFTVVIVGHATVQFESAVFDAKFQVN